MRKQDVLVVVISVAAFAILALVVQPLITGGSLGLPVGGKNQEGAVTPASTIPTPTPRMTAAPPQKRITPTPTTPAPTPTPWDGTVKTVGFVNQPGSQGQLPPNPTIPPDVPPDRSLTTYAVITGQWSGTTENLMIPFPSWVLEYEAEPTTTSGEVFPRFVLQVFDVQNPNRDVFHDTQIIIGEPPEDPWVHKFYEGNREYSFKMDTRFIKSYTITIKVPTQYTV
ncbi:MAG: hypothetical protein LUO96_02740 [Methanomicrobiales archaeon]|nr:hypothetical protein [Methanomicrobiales archaeon]